MLQCHVQIFRSHLHSPSGAITNVEAERLGTVKHSSGADKSGSSQTLTRHVLGKTDHRLLAAA